MSQRGIYCVRGPVCAGRCCQIDTKKERCCSWRGRWVISVTFWVTFLLPVVGLRRGWNNDWGFNSVWQRRSRDHRAHLTTCWMMLVFLRLQTGREISGRLSCFKFVHSWPPVERFPTVFAQLRHTNKTLLLRIRGKLMKQHKNTNTNVFTNSFKPRPKIEILLS